MFVKDRLINESEVELIFLDRERDASLSGPIRRGIKEVLRKLNLIMTIVYWLVTFVQEILDSFRKHPIDRAQAVALFLCAIFPFISLFYEVVDQLTIGFMIHLEPSISSVSSSNE